MIKDIESAWRETGIHCPFCDEMTYSDGQHRPQCPNCLELLSDETIWQWLITDPNDVEETFP